MPSDGNFTFSVLIAGLPVPEYHQDGKVYVESNLWTPVSYKQSVREMAYGEIEEQEWPVTPYQVKVSTQPHTPDSWYYVYVDGVKVHGKVLGAGREWLFPPPVVDLLHYTNTVFAYCKRSKYWNSLGTRIYEGFNDAEGTREFLFALPRFARDECDRIEGARRSKIGTIEVVRYGATFLHDEWRTSSRSDIDFDQANKKDANGITGGRHTMSTTKKGKLLNHLKPSPGKKRVEIWSIGGELGRLSVEYHMGHTLQEKGLTLQKMDWMQATHSETVKFE